MLDSWNACKDIYHILIKGGCSRGLDTRVHKHYSKRSPTWDISKHTHHPSKNFWSPSLPYEWWNTYPLSKVDRWQLPIVVPTSDIPFTTVSLGHSSCTFQVDALSVEMIGPRGGVYADGWTGRLLHATLADVALPSSCSRDAPTSNIFHLFIVSWERGQCCGFSTCMLQFIWLQYFLYTCLKGQYRLLFVLVV